MNYITLVINLDDSTERLQSVDVQLKQQAIAYQRVPAFDGRKMSPYDCNLYNERKAIAYMGRSLLGGEIGCYLSHLKCAKKLLESNATYALVLEDDVKINCKLKEIIESFLEYAENEKDLDWDLINIGAKELKIYTIQVNLIYFSASLRSVRLLICATRPARSLYIESSGFFTYRSLKASIE